MAGAEAAERVCVALDRPSVAENRALVRELRGHARWYKVGLRGWAEGCEALLDDIRGQDARLFLDLKFHDIPATVEGAARAVARVQPDLLTVHASGGAAMVEGACRGLAAGGATSCQVLAVTVLTSLDAAELDALGVGSGLGAWAEALGARALAAGAAGLVCSGHEVASLRAAWPGALLVVPGIRPTGAAPGDQRRTLTPAEACSRGASLLVVGRPIWRAADPVAALAEILEELQ